MCGLAGIVHRRAAGGGANDVDRPTLRRMSDALHHRGPDGDGFHFEPGVGLAHRRLAIIDLGGGHQPMCNEDGSVAIVFNGEIYNHAGLKQELERLGHVFVSRCDTEVIVHAWESWGPDCLQRLNGMFAIAVWDRTRRCLFLARDRLGKKPIYYANMPDGRFVFASEMAALCVVPELTRKLDAAGTDDFFSFGYIPDPRTIYQGIHRLEAAHFLLVEPGDEPPRPRRYWRLPCDTAPPDDAAAAGELVARLRHSVAARLIADVPLGAFLSGGIDSSAVVALAAGLRDTPLSTFTIGFPGVGDERPFAGLVADRYGTEHHEDTSSVDYVDAARDQARIFGEPFGDSSSVPTLSVCRLARRHVTVALSGDGGDEVLAGYRRYRFHCLVEAARRLLPSGARRSVIGPLARLYPKLDRAPRWLRGRHTLTELSLDSALGYYRTLCKSDEDRRRSLFTPSFRAAIDGHDPADRIAALMADSATDDPLRQAQFVDINTYLPGDILTKVDRTSMATSLEVRGPLLDHEFVAWGVSLPARLKLRQGGGKYILKQAMAPLLPEALLHRRKQGFATSPAAQFRQHASRLRERLLGPAVLDSGIFDGAAVARLLDEHAGGRFDHSSSLWLLLVFEGFLAQEAATSAPIGSRADAHFGCSNSIATM